jgi:uncharacterized protein YndB with AHSA1/START domain
MMTTAATTTQVYQVFIRATPEHVWEAITTPEFTARYFHGARITVTPERLRSVGVDDSLWADETESEYEPPRRLVHSWRSCMTRSSEPSPRAGSLGRSSRAKAACAA